MSAHRRVRASAGSDCVTAQRQTSLELARDRQHRQPAPKNEDAMSIGLGCKPPLVTANASRGSAHDSHSVLALCGLTGDDQCDYRQQDHPSNGLVEPRKDDDEPEQATAQVEEEAAVGVVAPVRQVDRRELQVPLRPNP